MSQVISEEYRKLNIDLHNNNEHYGDNGHKYVDYVNDICREINSFDVLDYGCGKGMLNAHLPFEIKQYDPAILKHSLPPSPADIVICNDVLEHIEPECLDAVIDDLHRVTKKRFFATVHVGPALKVLEDGRNAHLIQETSDFWIIKILQNFEIMSFNRLIAKENENETLMFLCKPRNTQQEIQENG